MRAMKIVVATLVALIAMTASGAPAKPVTDSIYQLSMTLIDQASQQRQLDLYRGQPTLVTMFYSSCPMACPLLIDTVRSLENALAPAERSRIRVLMVSMDPERDTPQALADLAKRRRIDTGHWTLAKADENDVRMLAAALNIQYRKLPGGGYNHTSVITLLDSEGHMVKQSSVLGQADAALLTAIKASLADEALTLVSTQR